VEAATTAAAAAAFSGVGKPGAGEESQSEQYRDRPFHVSLLAENPDEKV
jgi:hypothetical protein